MSKPDNTSDATYGLTYCVTHKSVRIETEPIHESNIIVESNLTLDQLKKILREKAEKKYAIQCDEIEQLSKDTCYLYNNKYFYKLQGEVEYD